MTAPGTPESLSRLRSAAAAASSATEITVAESSPPWASRLPRQSSSGARPATPIATSHWPWRQARPNESVTTTLQSYAKAGAGASARQDKVLSVLAGGKTDSKKDEESAA